MLIPPRNVCKPQPNWLLVNVLKLKVPARGESCPSGPRRGPAEPGGDKVLSPNQKSFHISTTNCNTLATKTGTPLSILPLKVWKPQPHCLAADGLGLMEPAGCEGCPSGQGRGYAAHRDVNVPSPGHKALYVSTIPANLEPRR